MNVLLKASEAARMLGISESSWWKGVKDGCFPAPIKLGKRMTRWRSTDVEEVMRHDAASHSLNLQMNTSKSSRPFE